MKFQVIGASRDTGARMTLEFEAESKAAAERKAAQQGMEVRSVREVGGSVAVAEPAKTKGRGSGGLIGLVLLIAIVAVAAYLFWPRLAAMLGK